MSKIKKQANKKTLPNIIWKNFSPAPIIGVDEVGRGCLAGRVYAAAVILNYESDKYTDSKLLSEKQREEVFSELLRDHQVGIGYATAEEVDKINILRASLLAMRRAVVNLKVTSGHLLVDGTFPVPDMNSFSQTTLIKGDLRAQPIGAASIVAKVTRDRYMQELAAQYPQYDFEKHKGYSTEAHKQKIAQFGPTIEHRKTFRGVREYVSNPQQASFFSGLDL